MQYHISQFFGDPTIPVAIRRGPVRGRPCQESWCQIRYWEEAVCPGLDCQGL
jgi:hypothetical protein